MESKLKSVDVVIISGGRSPLRSAKLGFFAFLTQLGQKEIKALKIIFSSDAIEIRACTVSTGTT